MEYLTDYAAVQTSSPPAEMYVREAELKSLRETLRPIAEGYHATGAVVHGPSGAGKTHAAQLIVGQLADAVRDGEAGRFDADRAGPETVVETHIDCWDHSSASAILRKVLAGLGEGPRPANTPTAELSRALRDALECPYVVILDEADQISDDGVLKTLHEVPDITLLCITNEYRPFLRAREMGVESRLEGYQEIGFDAYSESQLRTILEGRISHGVAAGVVPEAIVGLLAEVSKHDARRAIDNLRRSVVAAEQRGLDAVTPTVVREVVPETERELIQTTFSKLTRDQRILYEILVEDGGELSIGDVYGRYCERVDSPASKKTAKRELKKLSHYHIVDYGGENSARRYWAATDELYPDREVA